MNNQSLGMTKKESISLGKEVLEQSQSINSINHSKISDVSREFRE